MAVAAQATAAPEPATLGNQTGSGQVVVAQADQSAAPETLADPECLTVTQSSETTYVISNSACGDQSVLTAIELGARDAATRCFTKKIRSQISIASDLAAPIINYQCIEGTTGCTTEILRGMFPECRAG